jgi:hypothetical protein
MAALGVWVALSSLWSISTSASVREAERMLVYVALALAIALVLRRRRVAGALIGVTCLDVRLATGCSRSLDMQDDPVNATARGAARYRTRSPCSDERSSPGAAHAVAGMARRRARGSVRPLTLYFTSRS